MASIFPGKFSNTLSHKWKNLGISEYILKSFHIVKLMALQCKNKKAIKHNIWQNL